MYDFDRSTIAGNSDCCKYNTILCNLPNLKLYIPDLRINKSQIIVQQKCLSEYQDKQALGCNIDLSYFCAKMSNLSFKSLNLFLKGVITKLNNNMLYRFGIKLGIAAGAVYYLSEQGVWRSSDESHQIYGKLNTILSPYVKQVTENVPIEVSEHHV